MLQRSHEIGHSCFWPLIALFNEFDSRFLDFDNGRDAVSLANWLVSNNRTSIKTRELAVAFPEFSVRRLNSALNYLEGTQAVEVERYMDGGQFTYSAMRVTERTRRFVKNRS